ncbi:MAG: universal stress protein [Gaiella sp.]
MKFRKVIIGVDPSTAADVAVEAGRRLVEPAGTIALVGVGEIAVVGGLGTMATSVVTPYPGAARERVDRFASSLEGLETRTVAVEGAPTTVLLDAAADAGADLIVVGSHDTGRMAGIVLGSTATAAVHDASCSVLVARGTIADGWPRKVVVGIDGSAESLAALSAARAIAERAGADVVPLLGIEGISLGDLAIARESVDGLEESLAPPVKALVEAAEHADLVVVGSRGLKGLKALGSVSERVAHKAPCSVLVVR